MNILSRIDKSVIAATFILLMGLGMIYYPISDAMLLYHAIHRHARHIALQLGDYYLIGGGVILSSMMLFGLFIVFTRPAPGSVKSKPKRSKKKPLTMRQKIVQWAVGIFFLLVLVSIPVLPQLMRISVEGYLKANGYTYCDNLSSQWLYIRTMVFRRDTCHPTGTQNNLFN